MIRLATKIAALKQDFVICGDLPVDDRYTSAVFETDRDIARHGVTIIADEVALLEPRFQGADAYTNISPPEPKFVIEWMQRPLDGGGGAGLPFAVCVDSREAERLESLAEVGPPGVLAEADAAYLAKQQQANRVLFMSPWTRSIDGRFSGMPMWIGFHIAALLDDAGSVLDVSVFNVDRKSEMRVAIDGLDLRTASGALARHMTSMALFTLSLMGCKNVTRTDATASHGPPAKWIKQQRAPTVRYEVLRLGSMRDTLKGEGNIDANGPSKALHICRGHFAQYDATKPLFGKYAGKFWIPSHVRGSLEHGAVVKDYNVKPKGSNGP